MARVTEILPFQPEHRAEIRDVLAAGCEAPADLWELVAQQGASITLRVDGRAVMCGGIVELANGEYEAWAVIDVEGRKHARAIHRAAKDVLNATLELCGRIRAFVVWDGFPQGHRWVQSLGFKRQRVVHGQRLDGRLAALYVLEAA